MPTDTMTAEPVVTGEIAEMNKSGDTKITWSTDNEAEVDAARAHFDRLRKTHVAYVKGPDGKDVQIRTFDPRAGKITMTLPPIGG